MSTRVRHEQQAAQIAIQRTCTVIRKASVVLVHLVAYRANAFAGETHSLPDVEVCTGTYYIFSDVYLLTAIILRSFIFVQTDFLSFHRLASSVNLYRFTHFHKISFRPFWKIACWSNSPNPLWTSSYDDGYSFLLNASISITSGRFVHHSHLINVSW